MAGESLNSITRETGIQSRTLRHWRNNAKPTVKDYLIVHSVTNCHQLPTSTIKQTRSVVLAIPDLHCPFEHQDALAFLKAVKAKFHPTEIVCLGDEIDAHAYSKWPKDPDGMGAGQELKAAIEAMIPFYVEFPVVRVCISNHTIRPMKMMKMIGLPSAFFPQYSTMLNSPDGWSWHEHIIIDGVRYMHGDQGKGGQNGWTKNSEVYHQSTVVGHWHSKAGVYYDSGMFNLNAGCLINDRAYAFDYAKNSHKRPNLGCAIIMDGKQGHFIPMLTDEEGRWVGKL
jgi:hypothetical protein